MDRIGMMNEDVRWVLGPHGTRKDQARWVIAKYEGREDYASNKTVQLWVEASKQVLADPEAEEDSSLYMEPGE
jgi:hypothetical protein